MIQAKEDITEISPKRVHWRLRFSKVLFFLILAHFLWQVSLAHQFYLHVINQTVPTIEVTGGRSVSNVLIAEAAAQRGMSLSIYAIYTIFLTLVVSFGFLAVSVLVVLKAKGQWFLWFTAFFLLFYPTGGGLWLFSQVAGQGPSILQAGSLLWPLYWLFLYLFPNGKAEPRGFRLPVALFMGLHFFIQFIFFLSVLEQDYPSLSRLVPENLFAVLPRLFPILLLTFFLVLAAQVIRFLRISTRVERVQTRWVVVGLGIYILLSLFLNVVIGKIDIVGDQGFFSDLDSLLSLIIPVTIGISILRFHLFDIDLVIRRTFVYSLLTAMLGSIYLGAVILFQSGFQVVTGRESPIAVVLSTLVVAALFNPIRRRLQDWIDRSFFRQKYNTELALSTFGASLRENIEFDQMTHHLLSVVDQSLQPKELSLWLVPPEENPRQEAFPPARVEEGLKYV